MKRSIEVGPRRIKNLEEYTTAEGMAKYLRELADNVEKSVSDPLIGSQMMKVYITFSYATIEEVEHALGEEKGYKVRP